MMVMIIMIMIIIMMNMMVIIIIIMMDVMEDFGASQIQFMGNIEDIRIS